MKLFLNEELLAEEPHHSQLRAALARLAGDSSAVVTLAGPGGDRLEARWDPHIGIVVAYRTIPGLEYEDAEPLLPISRATLVFSSYARQTESWRSLVRWCAGHEGVSRKRIVRALIKVGGKAYGIAFGIIVIFLILSTTRGMLPPVTLTALGIGSICLALGVTQTAASVVEHAYWRDIRPDGEDFSEGFWSGVMMTFVGALVLLGTLFT